MILKDQKIFFHHIPKTGGKAIDDFLFNYYNLPYKGILYFTEGYLIKSAITDKTIHTIFNICHLQYFDLIQLAQDSGIEIDNSWDIFTIVRNPYYRAASAIFFQPYLECHNHMHTLSTLSEKRKLFKKAYNAFFTFDWNQNDHFSHRVPQHILLETKNNNPSYKMYKYEEGLENIISKELGHKIKGEIKLKNIHSIDYDYNIPKTNYLDLFTRGYIEKINEYYYEDFGFCGYEMWDPLDFPE